MITLNQTFLKEYHPKNHFYTTVEEMQRVDENCILEYTLDDIKEVNGYKGLQEIRNKVVGFYTQCMKNAKRREIEFGYMEAMQSVTAVIDNLIYA